MSVVSLQDIRDEGLSVAVASDAKVLRYISIWEAAFEAACGQWFESRDAVVTFDGDDTTAMFLRIPIISVTSLEDLENEETIDAADYAAYTGRSSIMGDDRRNPKVVMTNGKFWLGRQRWRLTGAFGYIEQDDSTPGDVWYAMIKLIIEKLLTPLVASTEALLNQELLPENQLLALVEEVTDDHKRKWSNNAVPMAARRANSGLTQDPYILETINKYRAPMNIQTQTNWQSLEGRPSPAQIFYGIFGYGGTYGG